MLTYKDFVSLSDFHVGCDAEEYGLIIYDETTGKCYALETEDNVSYHYVDGKKYISFNFRRIGSKEIEL